MSRRHTSRTRPLEETDDADRLAMQLVTRLRQKASGDERWYLDLRHRAFADLNAHTVLLRNPEDAGWPDQGRTTTSRNVALEWVRIAYGRHFARSREALQRDGRLLTVGEAAVLYVEACLSKTQGDPAERRAIESRLSVIRNHVLPHFATTPLVHMTHHLVHTTLSRLIVQVRRGQDVRTRPASPGTKQNVRNALGAIWRHNVPVGSPPFRDVRLVEEESAIERRLHVRGATTLDAIHGAPKGLTPQEVRAVLVAASAFDAENAARANLVTYVPNTAASIAFAIALGTRISELCGLRWEHVHEDEGYILIPGTKNVGSFRPVPLQNCLHNWLREHRALESMRLGRTPKPNDYLFRTSARRPSTERPSIEALRGRWSRVLERAQLSQVGRATHWARATHATWGAAATSSVSVENLRRFLGHASAHGATTGTYVEPEKLVRMIEPKHREYIDIPAYDEVERAAQESIDATCASDSRPRASWRERKRPWKRDRASREERAARRALAQGLPPLQPTARRATRLEERLAPPLSKRAR